MPPYRAEPSPLLAEEETETKLVAPQAAPRKYQIIKTNLVTFGYGHLAALYGLYLCFTEAKWQTILMSLIIFVMSSIGVTAGAHRLWSHKSYKAKTPLQIILMVMNTFAFQNSAIHWVREHRLHHKYSDTDADPHNATRGFFYSHIGWLLVKKHPEVKKRGKTIDMSDIYANPVLQFQKKYAIPFIGTVCFVLPTVLPVFLWGECLKVSWHVALLRYVTNLHTTFLVNSAAHLWGNKPYDKSIKPAQNKTVSFLAFGEGFHNYHHVFPWDYKTAELGNDWLNLTTLFIDFFAWIGWAYDLKTVPDEVVLNRAKRTGDGSYENEGSLLSDRDLREERQFLGDNEHDLEDKDDILKDNSPNGEARKHDVDGNRDNLGVENIIGYVGILGNKEHILGGHRLIGEDKKYNLEGDSGIAEAKGYKMD